MQKFIADQLHKLAVEIGARPTGSAANRIAAAHLAQVMASIGLTVTKQPFACKEWIDHGAHLCINGVLLPATTNPFSPSCTVTAPLVVAATRAELNQLDLNGKILVLQGELTAESYFPKNYPFVSFAEQLEIIATIEHRKPAAIVAVSSQLENPAPIFDDGDFTIPSVTVTADVGKQLIADNRSTLTLTIASDVSPAQGANVIGRLPGPSERRVVICAHFDTKPTTPGALDNAAGVTALLGIAKACNKGTNFPPLEFVAFNGEEHYAAPGETSYLESVSTALENIALLINIDGVGLCDSKNSIAFFNCPDSLTAAVRQRLTHHPTIIEVEPWPQSDHMIFAQRGVPCLAFSSVPTEGLFERILHTPQDTMELVNTAQIKEAIRFISELIREAIV